MFANKGFRRSVFLFTILSLTSFSAIAQDKKGKKKDTIPAGRAVLWEPVDTASLDLFHGPGGTAMMPDLSRVEFIEEEKSGHNKKYRIRDAAGRVWVAKLGSEAQPETAAVRLLYGLGYKTEINYLAPTITIPGKGTFKNVRLEARPDSIKRLDEWKWRDNPFMDTNELQGLKIMMVFLKNWDLLDLQNKVLLVNDNGMYEHHYVISDLGATIGKLGNNNLPIFFRLGRKTGDPGAWYESGFVKGVEGGMLAFDFKGKSRDLMDDITVPHGRWLLDKLKMISDKQVDDAFRAANYSGEDVATLRAGFKARVEELDMAVSGRQMPNDRDGN